LIRTFYSFFYGISSLQILNKPLNSPPLISPLTVDSNDSSTSFAGELQFPLKKCFLSTFLPAGEEGMILLCRVFFHNWDFTGVLIVVDF